MPWPSYIKNAFEIITAGATHEYLFYGPYNTLLNFLFPAEEGYLMSAWFRRPHDGWPVDFTNAFLVLKSSHPVFFIQVKLPGDYESCSARASADEQMRMCFFDLADDIKLPVLYGASALGTRLRFYTYRSTNKLLSPHLIPEDSEANGSDVAPAELWNLDLFSDEGYTRVMQIVNEVKAMVCQHSL
ncbi:hypothetical protein BDQ12DRAFT_684694 [Crucibulum laeve]|uniref:Uncharacterized protein n=1 Tax=Crucibulum laeve TaxID=68775 RepID=A0A5C3LY74_9AGAR|nr:hypothetical protein BDQ12DRAFT_684694 [Crucibulum laeve]